MTSTSRSETFVRRRRTGQALAEFALVAPIFFLLFFGIIEAGRFMFYYEVLNNATREGARYAIVNGASSDEVNPCPTGPPAPGSISCDTTGDQVRARVRQAAFGVLGAAVVVTPVWHDPADNGRGSTITVTASYTYRVLVPIVPLPAITVEAESSLVINN
jgi:Flp pilus assembly protein TadG